LSKASDALVQAAAARLRRDAAVHRAWVFEDVGRDDTLPSSNQINRYVFGSDIKDAKKNPDGSLTIYIQADSPAVHRCENGQPDCFGLDWRT
jgi:hypothetical protein